MAKKNNNGTIVFVLIVIIAAAAALYSYFSGNSADTKGEPDRMQNATVVFKNKHAGRIGGDYIAALYIQGTIADANSDYNQAWLLNTISALQNDNRNIGLLLYIDSPGGGVYEADEAYLALLDYKKTGKPVYAYLGPLAASGGYYIACAADTIYANRNTLTGSIGVIAGESVDLTGLMSKYGVKMETITAGKNKNMLNINAPLTDEQRAIMQSVADDAYEQFTGIVSASRKMKIADVKKLADGRIYTAHQALANGLIDSIGSWDDAVTALSAKAGKPDCKVAAYQYESATPLFRSLTGLFSRIGKKEASAVPSVPDAVLKRIAPDVPYPAYIYRGQ